ncbi:Hsp33 family molecular chaperone HslO [Shigella flexneri]
MPFAANWSPIRDAGTDAENHNYPQPVTNVLAKLLVATSLLTATLKFKGDITVSCRAMAR